jgi:hypothetical protein
MMRLPKLRTVYVMSAFASVAALGLAGALIMVGIAQLCDAFSAAWQSEWED